MLTEEEIESQTEYFLEYLDDLEEKAIILKNREDFKRAIIVKPSDSSRYFEGGQRKTKRNIKTRFGNNYLAPGILVTLTYDPSRLSRWQAWAQVSQDIRRFLHAVTVRYGRAGRKSPRYIWVIEEQRKTTGYPHVHIFYPRLHWLVAKEDVEDLWGHGRTRVEHSKGINVGRYICKYITKLGGWSEEALAFIWTTRKRMYGYSRCYKMPESDKDAAEWAFLTSSTRTRIEDNLAHILNGLCLENIEDYLEGLPRAEVRQGRAKRGRRRALTDRNPDNEDRGASSPPYQEKTEGSSN